MRACGDVNCRTVSAAKRLIRGAKGSIDRIFWRMETFFESGSGRITTLPTRRGMPGERWESLKKLYRGWMKSGLDHCLFETIANDLKTGDTLTDAFGRVWIVEVIF